MNDLTNQLLDIIAPALGALLTVLIGYLLTYINVKKNQLKQQTNNELAQKYIDMIANTVTTCVEAINQTYVDSLKDSGSFTKEAQEEAFKRCYNQVLSLLSDDCKQYIKEIFGDIQSYLTTVIESTVKEVKKTN